MNNLYREAWNSFVSSSDYLLLCGLYRKAIDQMAKCHHPEYGLEVSLTGTYSHQLWLRDAGVGALGAQPGAIRQTVASFLKHQLASGEIPYRIERVHHVRRFWLTWTKKLGVDFITRQRPEPIFRKSRYAVAAADSVPILVMSYAQAYFPGRADEEIIAQLDRAVQFEERQFFDDNLALFNFPPVSDWMDDISVAGFRSFTNVLWWRAYAAMRKFHHGMVITSQEKELISHHTEQAKIYRKKCFVLHGAIQRHLVHTDGYVMAGMDDTRVDTAASIMYALFNPSQRSGRKTLAAISHLRTPSGFLRNFDREYEPHQYRFWFRFFRFTEFANKHVYPWHNHLELMGRIRLMNLKSIEEVSETIALILRVAKAHQQNGDFHEVVTDDVGSPAFHTFLGMRVYNSTAGFLASVGTWIAAMNALAASFGESPEEFFGLSQPSAQ
ncbi:hypothetical protein BH11PAT4_BH11PAT4_2680 [soil metagenome]